ncbi:hypothetical protein [Agaribacter marinus]|uniref:Uncharacterized protein n=1 Tax=Agaribacter marinus TaxID=1431249 RepID=A0AA37WHN9_9ALTE|nr:hypothetical protein [Agaribacter marinus]GLR70203.1 hypothetical protein GCM10007852_11110 [Agaribacter marinus]
MFEKELESSNSNVNMSLTGCLGMCVCLPQALSFRHRGIEMHYEQVETVELNSSINTANSLYEQLVHDYPFLSKSLLERYVKEYANDAYTILAGVYDIDDMGSSFGAEIYQNEIDYLVHGNPDLSIEELIWRKTTMGLKLNEYQKAKLNCYIQ